MSTLLQEEPEGWHISIPRMNDGINHPISMFKLSYNLNSLKGGYTGDSMGGLLQLLLKGDTRSLDLNP